MSQRESDPGTGVQEVIDLLLKAPPERLWTLTGQLGPDAEEDIVHALSLFILHQVVQALDKLQTHADNVLAKHLLEKWQRDTRSIEEYRALCGDVQEAEALVTLARVFKVLTQHGLCDRALLNLAYKRALPRETSDSDVLKYNFFLEEAKQVCGPEFVEVLYKFNDLKLVSGFRSKTDAGNSSATTGSAQDLSRSDVPTSLQTTTSVPSFPSNLEISLPSAEPQASITRSRSCPDMDPSGQNPLSKPSEPTSKGPEEPEDPEHEEVMFYSFVILHAQNDQDEMLAEELKDRIEGIIQRNGATYSGEFGVPGKYEIDCIEDAINNSAFSLLLLTANFNRYLQLKTNTAIINSIRNPARAATVIPLLPQRNAMPKDDFPMVLHTLIPLVDNRHFEKKIKTALSPAKINQQKKEWMQKQSVKKLKEQQEKLKKSIEEQQEGHRFHFVPEQRAGPDGSPRNIQQQQPHIYITNSHNIMIGSNSQMAVNQEDGHREET